MKYLGINTISQGAVSSNNVPTVDPDGKTTRLFDGNKDGERRGNETSVFAFRAQLDRLFMDAAVESGVKLRTRVEVKEVDVENTPSVLEGGERISADLIIGPDGVHFVVRLSVIASTRFFPY